VSRRVSIAQQRDKVHAMKMSAALVAVALALLAGCGGSGGNSTDKDAEATVTRDAAAGDTMSAAAWSTRVKAICARSAAAARKQGEKLGRRSAAAGDSRRELAYKALALTSRLLDPWLDQIEALPKPEGREQDATKFIASMRDVGDVLGKTSTAIKQNDQTNGRQLVRQLQAKTASVRSQARALGIEKCNPPAA
jgi:hypothetical protein